MSNHLHLVLRSRPAAPAKTIESGKYSAAQERALAPPVMVCPHCPLPGDGRRWVPDLEKYGRLGRFCRILRILT